MTSLLLIRPDDHVLLGVRWTNLRLAAPTVAGGPFLLVPNGPQARLRLTFPPQHLTEEVRSFDDVTASVLWQSRLSGTSTLVFDADGSDGIAVSVDGLLSAANELPIASTESRIEIPWRLPFSPQPAPGDQLLATRHPVTAAAQGETSSLWQTRLRSIDSSANDVGTRLAAAADTRLHPIGLVALDDGTEDVDDPFTMPLLRSSRQSIVGAATTDAPASHRSLNSVRWAAHLPQADDGPTSNGITMRYSVGTCECAFSSRVSSTRSGIAPSTR